MCPSGTVSTATRDHLFISYAYEDEALAEWLALRLTSEGYKVWIDRFELLGGESYPLDIDQAIKNRTFRLLALLSRSSLTKPNPLKERTLALNLQRQRDEEFLLTLNVDNLRPDEMDWMTSDIIFIPFSESWAGGLVQLLKKLASVHAPKQAGDGMGIAANAYLAGDTLSQETEDVYANLLHIVRTPIAISCFTVGNTLSEHDESELAQRWAFWPLRPKRHGGETSDTLYFSFDEPPRSTRLAHTWFRKTIAAWRDVDTICDVRSSDIAKPLLRRALLCHLRTRGLRPTPDDPHMLYFPDGLVLKNLISFRRPDGRTTYRKVVGERSWPRGGRFAYHQAVTFDIRTDLPGEFAAQFRIRLHITDCDGNPLPAAAANARRKSLTRDWYNKEWLARHLGLLAFFADGKDPIEIGDARSLVLSSSLLRLVAPWGINEAAIPKGTLFVGSRNPNEDSG